MKITGALIGLLCGTGLLWPVPGRTQKSNDYAAPSSWLCWPGRPDACSGPLTSTIVSPEDGTLTQRTYAPDAAAPIDCFYVYPTVSLESTANADMALGPEEQHVAMEQFARFGARCRTFAPLYRQMTVAALIGTVADPDRQLAYRDVLAAWRYYLDHENQGRGVVLIGHSQGSNLLVRLLAEQLDGKPTQRYLVSAFIPGASIQVPVGRDVGGSFQHLRLCRSADQVGCVIAYSSYLATDPPGPEARFGAASAAGSADACVSPGVLTANGSLDSELPTRGDVATLLGTTFVENPGLVSGACVTAGGRTFLSISIKPNGVGSERLTRALSALDQRRPNWGLHALDVNLVLGNMVEIIGRQGQAWMKQKRQ